MNVGDKLSVATTASRAKSQTNTGGSQSFADSGSLSNSVNLGGLPISSTINRDKVYSTNGGLSGNLGHNLQIGNFGLNTQLGPNGLQFNYGPGQAQQNTGSAANAGSFATGDGSQTASNSGSKTQTHNVGNIGITSSQSFANSQASSQNGQTGAFANGASTASGQQGIQNQYPGNQYGQQQPQQQQYPGQQYSNRPQSPFGGSPGGLLGGIIGGALSTVNRRPQAPAPVSLFGGGFGGKHY